MADEQDPSWSNKLRSQWRNRDRGNDTRLSNMMLLAAAAVLAVIAAAVVFGGDEETPSRLPPPATNTAPEPSYAAPGGATGTTTTAPATSTTAPPAPLSDPGEVAREGMIAFSTLSRSGSNPVVAWLASLGTSATSNFKSLAEAAYRQLSSGILQAGLTVSNVENQDATELWSDETRSLWRVTTTRDVSSETTPELNTTESSTWDVLLVKDKESWKMDAFSKPSPENESAGTYLRPEGTQ